MNTVKIQVELSSAQLAQLKAVAKLIRSTPGNMLVALAFSKLAMVESECGQWSLVDEYNSAILSFVDNRHVVALDLADLTQCGPIGVDPDQVAQPATAGQ